MNQFSSKPNVTRTIIQTALFIALAVAVRNFSTMIYFLGAPGMRISFSPIFMRMPAILFGPFYGGIAGGLVDIISFVINPAGPYIPFLTMTQILDGVMVGLLWNFLKNRDTGRIQKVLWIIFIALGAVGAFNYVNTVFFPQSALAQAIDAIGKNKNFYVLGLVAVALVGIILLALDFAVQKMFPQAPIHKYHLKLLIAFGLAGLTVTTLNTWILQIFNPELAKIGFILFLIPRLIKEIFMIVIISYIVAFLISIYERINPNKTN